MNQQEREMIDGLFDRLRQAEQQGEPRDPEAEALIQEHMAKQPSASYLLAQVVLVQEQGLRNLQGRVEQLEKERAERPQTSAGGFLGGLFGGAPQAKPTAPPPPPGAKPSATAAAQPKRSGWTNPTDPAVARLGMAPGTSGQAASAGRGGGFMAGAMQTAMGVAGGVLLANAVTGMFADDSEAAETAAPADEGLEPPADEPMVDEPMEAPPEEDSGFFGDFFGGDEEF
ncbi:MAG: DUF2076 family protein [Gammaproteobacteria bacterium]|nr:DUF2076 family protein [Gammaproteobacteria bacterium]